VLDLSASRNAEYIYFIIKKEMLVAEATPRFQVTLIFIIKASTTSIFLFSSNFSFTSSFGFKNGGFTSFSVLYIHKSMFQAKDLIRAAQ